VWVASTGRVAMPSTSANDRSEQCVTSTSTPSSSQRRTRLWPNGVTCPVCSKTDRITARKGGYYRCNACQREFEYQQRMSDPDKTVCEACGGALDRLISRTAFSLKGGGWYKDLYASTKPEAKSDGAAKSDGGDKAAAKVDAPAASADKPAAKADTGSSSGGSSSGGSSSGGSTSGSGGASGSGGSVAKAS